MFADHSTLSCRFENVAATSLSTVLSNQLTSVFDWISKNNFKINTEKIKFTHFSYRQNLTLPPIKINSCCINQIESIKFIGIVFHKNLNFKQHITAICTKLSTLVCLLRRSKHYLPEEFMKKQYYSLIQPYIFYRIESWRGAFFSGKATTKSFCLIFLYNNISDTNLYLSSG